MGIIIQTLAVIGFLLSLYALYIEKRKEKEPKYKAICDISDKMSCTKAFSSKFGKMAGLSNSVYGMVFYILIFLLVFVGRIDYVFYLSIFSVLGSIYLAYISYFKLHNFCLVCHGIYLVNILLTVFSYGLVY